MLSNEIENELLRKSNRLIMEHISDISESLMCQPLFGAVGGSISLNLANSVSDIDCYLVTRELPDNILKSIALGDTDKTKVDFMCVSLDELIEVCEEYSKKRHKYPTRFYRSEEEMMEILSNHDLYRSTFKREMVMRIFMSEDILEFKNGAIMECYEDLKKGLRLIDIWDAHFNRAYGNYYEKIRGQEYVLLRKYLYTIHEIVVCHFVAIEKRPIMNWKQIVENCLYIDEIRSQCNILWKKNVDTELAKEQICVPADARLNHWIETKLSELLGEMKQQQYYLDNNYFKLGLC